MHSKIKLKVSGQVGHMVLTMWCSVKPLPTHQFHGGEIFFLVLQVLEKLQTDFQEQQFFRIIHRPQCGQFVGNIFRIEHIRLYLFLGAFFPQMCFFHFISCLFHKSKSTIT